MSFYSRCRVLWERSMVEVENKSFRLKAFNVFNKEGIFPPFLYVQHYKFGRLKERNINRIKHTI